MTRARIRAIYPRLAAAMEDAIKKRALLRRFASAVARRAGLRQGPATAPPRTVIDAYVSPDEEPFARQWITDLSGMTRIRFQSRSSNPVYLFASSSVSDEALNPGDFAAMLDGDGDQIGAEDSPATLEWRTLADEHRGVLRLTISSEAVFAGWNGGGYASPFAVSVEASS